MTRSDASSAPSPSDLATIAGSPAPSMAERSERAELLRRQEAASAVAGQLAEVLSGLSANQQRLARALDAQARPSPLRWLGPLLIGSVLVGSVWWATDGGAGWRRLGRALAAGRLPDGFDAVGAPSGVRSASLGAAGTAGGPDPRGAGTSGAGVSGEGAPVEGAPAPTGPAAGVPDGGLSAREAAALEARVRQLEDEVSTAREERNRHVGEVVRLRDTLVQREMQIADLKETLTGLSARVAEPDPPPAVVSRTSERPGETGLVEAVNAAFAASAVEDVRVVETGALRDGVLEDVLLVRTDPWGVPARAEQVVSARLEVVSGVLQLRLSADGDGEPPAPVAMPRADPAAWRAAGLAVPEAGPLVDEVARALEDLVAPHRLELVSLGGVEDGTLLDLVMRRVDGEGVPGERLVAARARLEPDGPTLVLSEGAVVEGGEERPFWRGELRVPLPGGDPAGYRAVVEAP